MTISMKKRWEIVFLRLHPLGPKMEPGSIAKYVKCSIRQVKYWAKRYVETGTVDDHNGAPRKRATTPNQDAKIIQTVEAHNDETLSQLQQRINKQGVTCSRATLHNRIKEDGLKSGVAMRKPLLTPRHREQRLAWAQDHKEHDWNSTLYADSTTMLTWAYKKKFWYRVGNRRVIRTIKLPTTLHIHGSFSSKGFGQLYCYTTSLTAKLMKRIYTTTVLPTAQNMFGARKRKWTLLEDNCKRQQSNLCKKWKADNKVDRMPFPPNSGDLNPIENVWGLIKNKLSYNRLTSVTALKRAFKREWKLLPTSYAQELCDSMRRRVDAVAAAEGDYILY
jgi:transposase